MATLVLSTVGTLVGGPVGGAIGALIGSQVDGRLLAPKGRQGARLGQLAVQTSTYGTPIAKLFGTLRVAGTVIWATDLVEAQHRSGGGKGQPKSTSYSYSASFAVALSGRPIRAVHRIWADGKLLRGAAGDWKSQTGFRLHPGGEGQAPDPLIASAEGIAATPAYRGIAYAVFEDLQLADYGNRIPSLTFEVEADAAPVSVADIAAALSDGAVAGTSAVTLGGYAAAGDSVRGALEALAQAMPLVPADDGARLMLVEDGAVVAIGEAVASDIRVERRAAGTLPDEVSIGYYEPARDYQTGLQRARRGGPGRRVESLELAAALAAAPAKALAEARLARDWAGRTTATVVLPWRRLELAPGTAVTLPGRGERWRVTAATLERMALTLELVATAPASGIVPAASAGRATPGLDAVHGPTRLALLDLAAGDGTLPESPRLWIAAAGVSPGWRRAELMASLDGGASWQALGATATPAVIGATTGVLPPGGAALRDDAGSVEVALLHDDMTLAGRDDIGAAADANLALIGDELVQFGVATRIGPARWRLSRLLRGRRGTEWASDGHAPGDRFVLVEPTALVAWDPPASAIGTSLLVSASGVGDGAPAPATATLAGQAVQPPAPVHLRGSVAGDGTLTAGWTRRSRLGWAWIDGDDVPLAEPAERYRVTVAAPGGQGRTVEVAAPGFTYGPAERAADGVPAGAALSIIVRQIGGRGVSPAARLTVGP